MNEKLIIANLIAYLLLLIFGGNFGADRFILGFVSVMINAWVASLLVSSERKK